MTTYIGVSAILIIEKPLQLYNKNKKIATKLLLFNKYFFRSNLKVTNLLTLISDQNHYLMVEVRGVEPLSTTYPINKFYSLAYFFIFSSCLVTKYKLNITIRTISFKVSN